MFELLNMEIVSLKKVYLTLSASILTAQWRETAIGNFEIIAG